MKQPVIVIVCPELELELGTVDIYRLYDIIVMKCDKTLTKRWICRQLGFLNT